jgi:ABC-type branched-subunit amino acid transport system ATPase component
VTRFPGRKPVGQFQGEFTTSLQELSYQKEPRRSSQAPRRDVAREVVALGLVPLEARAVPSPEKRQGRTGRRGGELAASGPRLLMLDEPSLGLAPIMVEEMFRVVREIGTRGVTVLLVEQNTEHALQLAHRGYVLESGRVALAGTGAELLANERVRQAYLGL